MYIWDSQNALLGTASECEKRNKDVRVVREGWQAGSQGIGCPVDFFRVSI